MTALPQDAVADLQQRIAELERQLETAVNERDAAIERQTASALVNFRLKNELRAVTDRQNASAEILNAIANTQGDAEHALQRIAETTQSFFNAASATIRIAEGDRWVQTVRVGSSGHLTGSQPTSDATSHGANLPATVYQENRQVHIPDLDNVDPSMADWPVTAARAAGIRTVCGSPLRRGGKASGALIVYRDRLAPFTEDELALQQSFADQAMIAIENARLFNETQQALTRQDATAEILRTVANTPGNADQSLRQVAETTARLFGAPSVTLLLAENGEWTKSYRFGASSERIGSALARGMSPVGGRNLPGKVVADDRQIYVPDLDNLPPEMADWPGLPHARAAGTRTACGTPLHREGKAIGALLIFRDRLAPFTEQELALQQTFADQAVIAIENARLFNETKEALERQTATADILKVIASSPSDVQPVFDAIAVSARKLISGAFSSTVFRFIDDRCLIAAISSTDPGTDEKLRASFPRPIEGFYAIDLIRDGQIVHFADTEADGVPLSQRELGRLRGFRSILIVPLMINAAPIGMIAISRKDPGAFSDHHMRLLRTFADQAVIAIENARLFNETKEALERQTATADILKVIASSPSDVQPVFEAIVNSAAQLFEPCAATITTLKDGELHWDATAARLPGFDVARARAIYPLRFDPERSPSSRAILERRVIEIPDVEGPDTPESTRNAAAAGGFRSITFVPLVDQHEGIGTIIFTHQQPGFKFSDKQLALVRTFADQAVIAIQNARLFNETKEALERQTATADILKVIASSPSDTTPVFDAIATSANRLLGGFSTAVFRFLDGSVHLAAFTPVSPAADSALEADFPKPVDEFEPFQLAQQAKPFPILDTEEVPFAPIKEIARLHGFRSMLFVPLMNGGIPIGIISVTRSEPGAFSPNHVQLLQTFADQAVIAIENVRLFNETQEALERQTATADILKVIASSPSEVRPVFDAILARSLHLCEAAFGFLSLYDGERFAFAAQLGVPPALAEHFRAGMDQPRPGDAHWQLLEGKDLIHNLDQKDEDAYRSGNPLRRAVVDLGGARSALVVALRKGGSLRGSVTIYRKEVRPFSASQIALLRHFADQAVIAIENTRLFNEVQERTVELTEALEQQTATSEVLSVISSSAGDLAPVFDAMLSKAMQLCSANFGVLNTYDGKAFHTAATYGLPPAYDEYRRKQPLEYGPGTAPARLVQGEPVVEFTDLLESEAYRNGEPNRRALVDIGGARCLLAVPLLKDERVVGNVMIFRQDKRPFSEKQITLLQQFAAQAVIAIENTRLLRELRESTEDLSESLQQQTATSEVLQIISSSPGDLAPVFDKMLENATRVCGAQFGSMLLVEDDLVRQAALYNAPLALAEARRVNRVFRPHPQSALAAAIRTKQVCQVTDMRTQPGYLERSPATVEFVELGGVRTAAWVPMVRDNEAIGVITIYRQDVHPFDDKQIELVRNFAKQAVIAIENARLLRELRERTEDLSESLQQQTATSEVLQIISASPGDLAPVFDKMLENATRVCGAEFGSMLLVEDDGLRQAALYNAPAALAAVRANRVSRYDPQSVPAIAISTGQVVQIEDVRASAAYLKRAQATVEIAELGGARTIVVVPMLRDDEAIGSITVYRQEVRPFSDKQVELLTNFARQAVIAIENARLLRELRQRTDDLTESLQFQTASADVLKVISRSPDALQPVLDVIVETSRELCGADASTIFLLREAKFHVAAISGSLPAHLDHLKANPLPVGQPGSILSRIYHQKRTINLENVLDDPELREGSTGLGGARALLTVPLLSEGQVIGAITLRQPYTRPFTPRQIQAVETFADQAVIAISNVNLFDEVQQRTRELSKSLDDLRTAQDRLIQTEKLASLGQLTAGIAHEIKNPLNFVNNFAALSAELTDELKDVLRPAVLDETIRAEVDEVTGLLKDNLSKVVQHGKRADSIVKNMLLHSREGSGEHRPADVNALVDESLNLAYHGARAEKPQFNVTLKRDFDPAAGMIEVFPQEITRVLLNLISNGFYAVTRRKADNGGGDFEPVVTAITLGRDDHVEIRIRDNGTGIPPEVKEKMFNPFFTTKPAGEGTGLGLSMSHDIIVKQHGGTIEVETEPGAFTEFRLVLPRTSLARTNGNR